jgi:hypothetical protein
MSIIDEWKNYIEISYLSGKNIEKESMEYCELKTSFYAGCMAILTLLKEGAKKHNVKETLIDIENELIQYWFDQARKTNNNNN